MLQFLFFVFGDNFNVFDKYDKFHINMHLHSFHHYSDEYDTN